MNKFQVVLTDHALDDLQDISEEARDQIRRDMRTLESRPFPSGTRIKRLRTFRPPVCRLRSGDYRVLYRIEEDTILLLRVIDRKLVERIIRRLKM